MTANGAQSPMERVYESLLMHEFLTHTNTKIRTRSNSFIYFFSLALAHTTKIKKFVFFVSYAHDMAKRWYSLYKDKKLRTD